MRILKIKAKSFLNELRVDHSNRRRERHRYFKIEMDQDKEIAALQKDINSIDEKLEAHTSLDKELKALKAGSFLRVVCIIK